MTNDKTPSNLYPILSYSAKCFFGAAFVLIGDSIFPEISKANAIWCLISVLLVLSPDGKDTMYVAMERIKANLLGAGVGIFFIAAFSYKLPLWSLCFIPIATISIGYLLRLQSTLRSALVATIVVSFPHGDIISIYTPLARAGSVFTGCFLGVVVTYLFHFAIQKIKRAMRARRRGRRRNKMHK